MTRRTWSPTGELVDSSLVRLYSATKAGDSKPEKIRIKLADRDGERWLSYATRTARTNAKAILDRAVARGEMFDAGTYRPATETPLQGAAAAEAAGALPVQAVPTWLEHAIGEMDRMAVSDKPKTREGRFDALRISCWTLVDDHPGRPTRALLKQYLDVMLEPVRPGEADAPPVQRSAHRTAVRAARLTELAPEVQAAGLWLQAHSLPVSAVRPLEISTVLDAFKLTLDGQPAAATTRSRKRNVLHHALEAAVRDGHLAANPMDGLDLRLYSKSSVREIDRSIVMTPAQAEAFLYNVGHDADGQLEPDDQYTAFFALITYEGVRPSEGIAARLPWFGRTSRTGWGEIGLEEALVHVSSRWADDGESCTTQRLKWTDHAGKSAIRTVPVSPETADLLERHDRLYGTGPDGRYFSAAEGGPINPALLKRLVRKARDRTFADPASPHYIQRANHPLRTMTAYACRHHAASVMLNSGVPPKEVANRLGHDVPVLLKIYASVMAGDAARANRQIDAYRAQFRQRFCTMCGEPTDAPAYTVDAGGDRVQELCSLDCLERTVSQLKQRASVDALSPAPRLVS